MKPVHRSGASVNNSTAVHSNDIVRTVSYHQETGASSVVCTKSVSSAAGSSVVAADGKRLRTTSEAEREEIRR